MQTFSLDLIIIHDDLEALALRGALEYWGVKVTAHFVGKAQDIVDIFQKEELSQHICIATHGDEVDGRWGFALPELAQDIAKQQPYDKILFASDLSGFLKLNEQHIVSLGCYTGSREIADAFLKSGARSYIAPNVAPFGHTSLYFALSFYYWLFAKKKSVQEAYEKATSMIDEEIDKFVMFEK